MKINSKTDFSKTLNLPRQVIGIKGNQVKKEEYILQKIQDVKRCQFVVSQNIKLGGKKYKIFEMPTDIENKLSSTIILNKLLKDFVVKYKLVVGDYVEHKLIFSNVSDGEQIETLPSSKSNIQELLKNRQQKRKSLANMFKGQILEINHLGTTINYDNDTLTTIKTDFEIEMIKKFYEMYKMGALKKELKTVHFCTKCGISKRRKDLMFEKKEVDNYYVLYKIKEDKGILSKYNNLENTYFVASTFSPYLMVTSENIAISNELEYSLVEVKQNNKTIHYILATDCVDELMKKEFIIKYETKQKFKAEELKDILPMNPLDYRKRVGILITQKDKVLFGKEQSTGVRIVSSGHTYIDYMILRDTKKDGIKPIINELGKTTGASIVFQNMDYLEVKQKIIDYLKDSKFIYTVDKIKINLPKCDKCGENTIYRPITDWYAVKGEENKITEEIFEDLLSRIISNKEYKKTELLKGVININKQKEALISDKNIMGTPIPVFYCADCGENIISDKTIEILTNMIKNKGSDTWYKQTPEEILQGQVACRKCGCTFFFKENATLNNFFKYICINLLQKDVLIKERTTTNLLIETKQEFIENLKALSFIPKYFELLDKFKKVLVHSSVNEKLNKSSKVEDEEKTDKKDSREKTVNKKRKFSLLKSKSSNIEIEDEVTNIINSYGTDILRLWAAIFSTKERIYLNSQNIVNINKKYKGIRRIFKFLLANLYDFNPNRDYIKPEQRNEIDKYVYVQLYDMVKETKEAYDNFEFNKVYKTLTEFGENMLSKEYFDSIKYKLYILNTNNKKRRSVQSNLYDIIQTLALLWLPIIPFTMEEIWPYIYHNSSTEERNIYSYKINIKNIADENNDVIMKWKRIFSVKDKFGVKIKIAMLKKKISNTLEAKVILNTNEYTKKFIDDNYEEILECINVSSIETKVSTDHNVNIEKEPGTKCVRCNHYSQEIGKDLRYRYLCPKCVKILDELEKEE